MKFYGTEVTGRDILAAILAGVATIIWVRVMFGL
jgi:hypothetical protein